ncbi:MAG: hypothetical protein QOG50_1294, partial [Actinomycetota bacterium]|nr:hypothetical protein [Actinomycetota bacterium]
EIDDPIAALDACIGYEPRCKPCVIEKVLSGATARRVAGRVPGHGTP